MGTDAPAALRVEVPPYAATLSWPDDPDVRVDVTPHGAAEDRTRKFVGGAHADLWRQYHMSDSCELWRTAVRRRGSVMAEEVVEVTIDARGNVAMHVRGVEGPGCTDTTEALVDLLGGDVTAQELTAEAYVEVSAEQQDRLWH
ncbi:hypothetical protein GCM10010532_112710 [Dactylosporangium siamense]|uniref:Uncharacterized protein n=1 Tax=Dactylosporangium siamense TaxID=685454 RepID=A0A919UIW1_9ACTN|nr:hypothetical protein Dsi01nite_111660 [Dactylosporangium siamense]